MPILPQLSCHDWLPQLSYHGCLVTGVLSRLSSMAVLPWLYCCNCHNTDCHNIAVICVRHNMAVITRLLLNIAFLSWPFFHSCHLSRGVLRWVSGILPGYVFLSSLFCLALVLFGIYSHFVLLTTVISSLLCYGYCVTAVILAVALRLLHHDCPLIAFVSLLSFHSCQDTAIMLWLSSRGCEVKSWL
jgi:hypothetical protein